MRYLGIAFLLLPFLPAMTRAADAPAAFVEPDAVLLNVSEYDLNRIIVDAFHRNGGPLFEGEKARVSSSVADLRYHARISDPVIRLGENGTARLSLDVLDASLRIGRLEKKIGGRQARCEEAGVDVDPESPLAVDLAFDLSVANGSLRVAPTSVEIPEVGDRIRLVEPARCKNAPFPRWFLWWLGKPYLRRSIGNLDEIVLARARTSAARLEAKSSLLTKRWEFTNLRLIPETLDTSGGSLLFGLTASSAGPSCSARSASAHRWDERAPIRHVPGSVGVVRQRDRSTCRHERRRARKGNSTRFRKLMASDAVYALVPGLAEARFQGERLLRRRLPLGTAVRIPSRRERGADPCPSLGGRDRNPEGGGRERRRCSARSKSIRDGWRSSRSRISSGASRSGSWRTNGT